MDLKGLTNLQKLDLGKTQITDTGLSELAGMNLTTLWIPHEAKTDAGLKHYLAAVESPTDLSLAWRKVTDAHFQSASKKQRFKKPANFDADQRPLQRLADDLRQQLSAAECRHLAQLLTAEIRK